MFLFSIIAKKMLITLNHIQLYMSWAIHMVDSILLVSVILGVSFYHSFKRRKVHLGAKYSYSFGARHNTRGIPQ